MAAAVAMVDGADLGLCYGAGSYGEGSEEEGEEAEDPWMNSWVRADGVEGGWVWLDSSRMQKADALGVPLWAVEDRA